MGRVEVESYRNVVECSEDEESPLVWGTRGKQEGAPGEFDLVANQLGPQPNGLGVLDDDSLLSPTRNSLSLFLFYLSEPAQL